MLRVLMRAVLYRTHAPNTHTDAALMHAAVYRTPALSTHRCCAGARSTLQDTRPEHTQMLRWCAPHSTGHTP